uniref:Glyco_transf_64 domain-containing protein n=1 Tax=Meloidogyne hapla TaxID=6305 RepID=A0A1I8BLN0_MELHA
MWKFIFRCKRIAAHNQNVGFECHERFRPIISEEEKRVFQSVRLEHVRLLEKLEQASEKLDAINKLIPTKEAELREIQILIKELDLLRHEYSDKRSVQLKLPHSPIDENHREEIERIFSNFNLFEESIDFSRCSITKGLKLFLYSLSRNSSNLAKSFYLEFQRQNVQRITSNPDIACLFITILDFGKEFKTLNYFGLSGRNHLLIDLSGELNPNEDYSQDQYLIDFNCSTNSKCLDKEGRLGIYKQSTFAILLPDKDYFQESLYESLEAGAIPVICSLHATLPFDEFVDWRLATIKIPPSRFSELHFILRSISVQDLLEMKRKGRFFFENLLADIRVLTRSIISLMRFRLQMPNTDETIPTSIPLYKSDNNSIWGYPSFISTATRPPYDDEYLGPSEYNYKLWNDFPFATSNSLKFMPNDYPLPSDSEFNEDVSFGMRPILPGSGVEFSKAIGGNRRREHFTILITTYNREQILTNTLERLIGLPYLNKVIVIWNDVKRAPTLPAWPRLRVPLLFINGTKNSLNNRFIPYKEIETEAVLSIDDDLDLKQYEIIFAFRVWREQRDRIVGFPARYHARFGDSINYDSNHTCQFYLHAYTYYMPQIIRDKVDEWTNCEDLAMNFLVSHLSRKPPIKTTSKWTLRCPTCKESLSNNSYYFNERHKCTQFFIQVYGYNPLLFSQFRADSVLFKTRVPSNHQKCFRYV